MGNRQFAIDARHELVHEGGLAWSLAGTTPMHGYCVSVDREARYVNHPPSVLEVEDYIRDNLDLLRDAVDRRYYLGGWYNGKENAYYLDVSIVVDDVEEALKIARRHAQKAIWNVSKSEELWL
jgi:hypothetical protein